MEKKMIEVSEQELADFAAFKEAKAKKDAAEQAKGERDVYKQIVDDEIAKTIPVLLCLSVGIKDTKKVVLDNFRSVLEMKAEVLKLTKNGQKSHTFTNSEGDKRIMIGFYETDGYRDTANDGIQIVKEYIESLAKDKDSKALVGAVLRLLSKDKKGELKASRVIQLRMMAEESGNERFIEGVRIIEESFQPAISSQFIKAEYKDKNGVWVNIPLGMTEA